jgi:hypothetical protein
MSYGNHMRSLGFGATYVQAAENTSYISSIEYFYGIAFLEL